MLGVGGDSLSTGSGGYGAAGGFGTSFGSNSNEIFGVLNPLLAPFGVFGEASCCCGESKFGDTTPGDKREPDGFEIDRGW